LAAIAEEYEPDTERLRAKVAALIEDRAVLMPATAEEKAPRRGSRNGGRTGDSAAAVKAPERMVARAQSAG
jgi:hypothetical protein